MPLYRTRVPKHAKLVYVNAGTPAGGATQQNCLYDVEVFNTGGYTYHTAGGFKDGIIVPSAGVYQVTHQASFVANSQYTGLLVLVNGAGATPDQTVNESIGGGGATLTTSYVIQSVTLKLSTGDLITPQNFQGTGPQPIASGSMWIYVEKKG